MSGWQGAVPGAAHPAGAGRAPSDDSQHDGARYGYDENAAVFVISVAAQLAGMHPQTLRQYDRLGLVSPGRAAGRGRRYSARDIAALRQVQQLSQDEGVNLAGIKRILDLQNEVFALRARVRELAEEVEAVRAVAQRIFAAGPGGDIVAITRGRRPAGSTPSTSLAVWRPSAR